MNILILILVLMFLMVILPYLLPIFALIAVVALLANAGKMLRAGRSAPEEPTGRRIEYTDPEEGPFRAHTDEVAAPDVLIERPASVRDEAFWEKDHTIYDVPFEEEEPTDEDQQ